MKYLLSIILSLSVSSTFAQQGYFQRYETDSLSVSGRQVIYHDECLYVLTGNTCENPLRACNKLLKITLDGDIIWQTEVDHFDAGNFNSLWLVNDTISITGHRSLAEDVKKYFMSQYDLEANLLSQHQWETAFSGVNQIINHSTYRHNDSWYLMGVVGGTDGLVDAIVMHIDLQGNLVSERIWDNGLQEYQIHQMEYSDYLESLVVLTEKQYFDDNDEFTQIEIFNSNNTTTPLVLDELETKDIVRKKLIPTGDQIYFIGSNEFAASSIPVLLSLDGHANPIDTFRFDLILGKELRRRIADFKLASNGDIIGVGYYARVGEEQVGWMFRLSPDLELIWETTFKSFRWEENNQIQTDLNDLIETPEGDIIAIGWENESANNIPISDLAILRVDSNGCLYEDNCDFFQFTTTTKDVSVDEHKLKIQISPNPTHNTLHLSTDLSIQHYNISSLSGTVFQKGTSEQTIDVSSLPSGLYFISVWDEDGNSATERFVKVE